MKLPKIVGEGADRASFNFARSLLPLSQP